MNVTSILETATAVVKSKEFKIVLIGLQLGFLALHYLSSDKQKQELTEVPKGEKPLLLES